MYLLHRNFLINVKKRPKQRRNSRHAVNKRLPRNKGEGQAACMYVLGGEDGKYDAFSRGFS